MKTVSHKDLYEPIIVIIQIEYDDEEGFEEPLEFLNKNTRLIENMNAGKDITRHIILKDLPMKDKSTYLNKMIVRRQY